MPAEHRFLRLMLPKSWYETLRAGTKLWLFECSCGHKRDMWDAGGVRYGAVGETRRYLRCPKCGRATWHKVRKKTDAEKLQM